MNGEEELTILLVEDSPADAILFREILADTSYSEHKLETVDRISKAIEKLDSQKIDIVVLDLNLPDSRGFDTFTRIFENYTAVPIIIYTVTNDEETALEAIRRGADDYLVKGPYLDTVQIEKSLRKAIELNNSRKAIRSSMDELKRSNGYLEHFAYVASHDLNAPMINLEELSKLVSLENEPQEYNQMIFDKINVTIQKMRNTLNKLFDVMEMHEKLDEPLEDLRFEEVMEEILQEMAREIKGRDAQVSYGFSQAMEVRFPLKHLRIILKQLLSNSLKYQPEGRMPQVQLRTYEQDHKYICLEVSDNGIGFDEELHSERIFDMFNRPHDNSNLSGVGLYTVKTLVENQGGKVKAKGEAGQGAVFSIYFKKSP